MGANCKQKDYIWIAEDAAFPQSACVSLIQQLNDWLANLRRSRQNHIQKHGSKPRSCVFMQSCSNFEFYFGQGNMWSRDVLSWSSEQQLIPDISQTQSAATLAGLGQWRPVKVTWDHIRIPSCRLCHGGRVKIWRKVKGVFSTWCWSSHSHLTVEWLWVWFQPCASQYGICMFSLRPSRFPSGFSSFHQL